MERPKTEEEWRAKLSPEKFEVLRCSATEPPFTGEYVHTKDEGIYRCGACGAELFGSEAKPKEQRPAAACGIRPNAHVGRQE